MAKKLKNMTTPALIPSANPLVNLTIQERQELNRLHNLMYLAEDAVRAVPADATLVNATIEQRIQVSAERQYLTLEFRIAERRLGEFFQEKLDLYGGPKRTATAA